MNMAGAHTNPALQKVEAEMSPKLAAHKDAIFLNPKLFARIQKLHDQREQIRLDAESTWLIERYLKEFTRAGTDERLIMGARTVIPFNGGGDLFCHQPDHWIFNGTGMKKGDFIPGLVGWEHHGAPAKIPGLEIVGQGTVWAGGVNPANWTATIFPGPKNNFVFNAATIFWPHAVSSPPGHMLPWSHWSRPHGPDTRVQRMMRNLLQRA